MEINIGPLLQPPYAGNPVADDATKQKIRNAVVELRLSYTAAILAALDAFVDDIHAGRIKRPIARPNWFQVKPATDCASEPIPPHETLPPTPAPKPKKRYFFSPLIRFLMALLSVIRAFWPALAGFVRTLLGAFGIGWSSSPPLPPPGASASTLHVTLDPYTFHYLFVGGPGQQFGEFGFKWRSNGSAAAKVSLQVKSYTYPWSPIPGFQKKPSTGNGTWQWVPQPGQTLWFRAMVEDAGSAAYSAEQRFQ